MMHLATDFLLFFILLKNDCLFFSSYILRDDCNKQVLLNSATFFIKKIVISIS